METSLYGLYTHTKVCPLCRHDGRWQPGTKLKSSAVPYRNYQRVGSARMRHAKGTLPVLVGLNPDTSKLSESAP
jgi:hypothetical protein